MKIAQIAPLMESVPPRLYGGTERIVSYLTDELVRLGHEVTLFASADSVTAAELVGCASTALRLDRNVRDPIPYYMLMLDRVRKLAKEFDILHFHIDQFHFPLFAQMADRTVTTLHGNIASVSASTIFMPSRAKLWNAAWRSSGNCTSNTNSSTPSALAATSIPGRRDGIVIRHYLVPMRNRYDLPRMSGLLPQKSTRGLMSR
jgi:glycosyltransferase involved in cell wall biosynthesis